MLSIKLARQSIRQNLQLYRPFIWATSATIALNFILALLVNSKGVAALHRASIVISFLRAGQVILAALSLVFLLYTYRFVQKSKASELGLYQILGLRKTNLVAISFWQQIMMLAITLAIGLVSGFVFSKALILLLVKLAGGSDFQLGLSLPGILIVLVAVIAAFGLLFMSDLFTILRSRALNLLSATKRSERNSKTHWLVLLIGLISLGLGYGLSLTIQTPTRHLSQILLAVMLVILATYCLFIAATTVILKVMANGRRYYQQPSRFIAVSNLLFRLRQNAIGLASIALLVTMTLVTLVTTAALYLGQQEYLRDYFPRDMVTQVSGDLDQARSKLDDLADQNQVKVSNSYSVATSVNVYAELKNDNQLLVPPVNQPTPDLTTFQLITLEQYQELAGSSAPKHLDSDQVLVADVQNHFSSKTIEMQGKPFQVKESLKQIKGLPSVETAFTPPMFIVVPDEEVLKTLYLYYSGNPLYQQYHYLFYDVNGTSAHRNDFIKTVNETNFNDNGFVSANRFNLANEIKTLYGGFFFLGLFFALTFILGTGLIIYYKQVSEGRADRNQFEILQQVGLSKSEILATIRSQVGLLFTLPIIMALGHLGFALPLIRKILLSFHLSTDTVLMQATATTVIVTIVLYYLIFRQTSRTYFREVTHLK